MKRFIVVMLITLGLVGGVLAQESNFTVHVVQRGENLFRIALGYGLTTEVVAAVNGIDDPASIQVGQRLLIPVDATETEADDRLRHIVQPGDTLVTVAAAYGVGLDVLLTSNGLTESDSLVVGQVLAVPQPEQAAADELETEAEPVPAVEDSGRRLVHVVQPGETLFRIATQYGLTVNQMTTANGITEPTLIYAGQQLIVPGVEAPQLATDLPPPLTDLYLTPQVLVEGKTGTIEVRTETPVTVSGVFLNEPVTAVPVIEGVYRIFLGVPVFTEAGVYPLSLEIIAEDATSTRFEANVQVIRGPYGSERINLLAGRDDLLNTNVEDAEAALLQRIVTPFNPERYMSGKMSLPAAAPITSGFGTRRSYNGGAFDRFHSGTDFAGAPGTPILAPAPGRVVLADTLNVRGNATVLDHGWGIYTGYWHQTEIFVELGVFVNTGQVIGTIGSTGRVTGAHLHWELWVNGVAVDPMQWVQQPFVTIE